MKRLITITLPLLVLALSCTTAKQEYKLHGGLDESKACVKSFAYDPVRSSDDAAAFTWDSREAFQSGATSFSIEFTTDISAEDALLRSDAVSVSADKESVTITDLKKGDLKYVRIRANYDGYFYSAWTYVDGSTEQMLCVGTGMVPVPSE